jgi:carbamoyltransferase
MLSRDGTETENQFALMTRMYILGISCFYHDASVALVKDGELLFAGEEERWRREKHYNEFPSMAVDAALKYAGITINDIDYIAFYEKPFRKFERMLRTQIQSWPRGYLMFMRSLPSWLKRKLWVPVLLQKEAGYKGKVVFVEHHLAHAASSFFVSPFEEAAILTLDGVGEDATTSMGVGRGNKIELTHEINFPHSLGLFYSMVTAWLGFKVNSGEGKIMGLASYGKPRFRKEFEDIIKIADDGSFHLNMDYFAYTKKMSMIGAKMIKVFGPPRQASEAMSEISMDMAATLQTVLEEVEVKLARSLRAKTGMDYLCIAGGVGLNSLANWRIMREVPYKDVFIQPAAGDGGTSVGAAMYLWCQLLGNERKYVMEHAYTGDGYTDEEIEKYLQSHEIPYRTAPMEEIVKTAARSLAEGKIVGWFHGRMEFGPRALLNRSILANPMIHDMKDVLNARVKHREPFRPFAPIVPVDNYQEYFDMHIPSPFMLLIGDVHKDKKDVIPAVTHVDGTARVQTLTESQNPLAYQLLKEFGKLTGVPVLLNTSFNIRGEPIVHSPADAYKCLEQTDMDYLFIGKFILDKKDIGKKELSKEARERIAADSAITR